MESIVAILGVLSILVLVFFGMLTAFMLTALYVFYVRRNIAPSYEATRKRDYHQSSARRVHHG